MLNAIQLSEDEAAGLTAERYDERSLMNQLMSLMVDALLITRGARGATLIVQDAHKKLIRHEIPGVSAGPTVDTTGCGDVFGSALLYKFLKSKDYLSAATFANHAAAVNATLQFADDLKALSEKLAHR